MSDAGAADAFDRFKWDILHDAVFEDWQGLWEPLWWLRGGGAIEGQSEEERQEFAERALRQLYQEGMIYFFQVPAWGDIGTAAADEGQRLGRNEVDVELAASWWRGRLLADHPNVWWGPTQAGEAAVNDPPDRIRASWNWPPQRS